ncbi:adenylate/guanylate cyclase domain-containing protein [Pseudovibrio exalbescens]|uniref:adenylate/guanylate cyclase domain-containing protein n=1 Tax=Pseudovibrio exalbescens TaxID=197461 RepID=UPI0023669CFB|nr:adenylate/guanylate cyclase domain-containing protein [Pseudovibrio exalbescens]MDD7909103.1 adenylate/guanylate cyclase domain-containing protein [Pseudovibrio exalbescens]
MHQTTGEQISERLPEEKSIPEPAVAPKRRMRIVWESILGPRVTEGVLPSRVRQEIARQEVAAERLIGIIQLGVIVFFAVLYAIAPRAEGSEGFNFVPYAITGYFLFTIVRIYLSFRAVLPDWYLIISVCVDVALLVAIIFSFHIQYGQHPAFYLKTPTLMYVFLFIALRALRFDPRFVLWTGAVATVGWLGLVSYALMSEMGAMKITRNYVDYLTSNAILIGAELDKLIIIISVTGLLSLALLRGRRMLFAAVREHLAVEDLSRFFDPQVANSIVSADEKVKAGQGMIRDSAILMVDIRSFTSTAATLTPQATMRVLALYQQLAGKIITEAGGQIDKFLGDGILATFGAVEETEANEAKALAAAVELNRVLTAAAPQFREAGWPLDFRIGVGVASGEVTVGVVGVDDRLEFTVIGDAVNRAAKLEDANKAVGSTVLTDRTTYDAAVKQGFSVAELNFRSGEVAGINGTVELVVLA